MNKLYFMYISTLYIRLGRTKNQYVQEIFPQLYISNKSVDLLFTYTIAFVLPKTPRPEDKYR